MVLTSLYVGRRCYTSEKTVTLILRVKLLKVHEFWTKSILYFVGELKTFHHHISSVNFLLQITRVEGSYCTWTAGSQYCSVYFVRVQYLFLMRSYDGTWMEFKRFTKSCGVIKLNRRPCRRNYFLVYFSRIHFCVTANHVKPGVMDKFINDVRNISADLLLNPGDSKKGQVKKTRNEKGLKIFFSISMFFVIT